MPAIISGRLRQDFQRNTAKKFTSDETGSALRTPYHRSVEPVSSPIDALIERIRAAASAPRKLVLRVRGSGGKDFHGLVCKARCSTPVP
jgi:uncharacterized protein YggL (DUF469 family)